MHRVGHNSHPHQKYHAQAKPSVEHHKRYSDPAIGSLRSKMVAHTSSNACGGRRALLVAALCLLVVTSESLEGAPLTGREIKHVKLKESRHKDMCAPEDFTSYSCTGLEEELTKKHQELSSTPRTRENLSERLKLLIEYGELLKESMRLAHMKGDSIRHH